MKDKEIWFRSSSHRRQSEIQWRVYKYKVKYADVGLLQTSISQPSLSYYVPRSREHIFEHIKNADQGYSANMLIVSYGTFLQVTYTQNLRDIHVCTPSFAISSVTSTMWPRKKIKQNIHFLSQIIYLP
jgi:hypothetical protein